MELHGDRFFGDDKAIVGGIAKINNIPVTIIATKVDKVKRSMHDKNKKLILKTLEISNEEDNTIKYK